MTEARPNISVVVLNHNGRGWLAPCLSALAVQTMPGVEVVLVDNDSTDGSADFVEDAFPAVRVLRLPSNLGFTGGNNAGARVARAPMLAFLNNDTVADAAWLSALKAALDADPSAGLATSRIVSLDDGVTIDSAGDGYLRAGGAFKRGHGETDEHYLEPAEVFGACGAAFMIRRPVFEELGGFDEDFFLVYEDVDLSYRAQLAGYRCLYVPEARVRHAGSATLGRVSPRSVFYGQRNLEWVYIKNTPAALLIRTLPSHLAYSLAGGVHLAATGRLGTWLWAKWSALVGLPAILRKRAVLQRSRRSDPSRLAALMERGWLRRKWREKRVDRGREAE
jgi:GT2 family glycosyltransferase